MEDIVFVGSPLHYTLYLFPDEEGYMFNAKREFFRRQDWSKQSGGDPEVSSRLFMERPLHLRPDHHTLWRLCFS